MALRVQLIQVVVVVAPVELLEHQELAELVVRVL
jgi:hypothetical protein